MLLAAIEGSSQIILWPFGAFAIFQQNISYSERREKCMINWQVLFFGAWSRQLWILHVPIQCCKILDYSVFHYLVIIDFFLALIKPLWKVFTLWMASFRIMRCLRNSRACLRMKTRLAHSPTELCFGDRTWSGTRCPWGNISDKVDFFKVLHNITSPYVFCYRCVFL